MRRTEDEQQEKSESGSRSAVHLTSRVVQGGFGANCLVCGTYEEVSKYSETQHVHASPRRTMDSTRQLLSQVNQPCQFAHP